MQRHWRFTSLLLALLAAGTVHADRHGGIEILQSLYGQSDRLCDAGRAVASACNGRSDCSFDVSNRLCGDPARGERKALWVAYRCGRGQDQIALFPENERGRLACHGGAAIGTPSFGDSLSRPRNNARDRIYMEQVVYGDDNRYCDATPVFARACDGRQRCEVRVDNRLCGDPARGERKVAEIQFWCNGRQEYGTIRENDIAYLSCP